MLRLKHGELEQLRTDLAAWVASKKSSGSHPRMSYTHATRMGIYRLHRGDDLETAASYLGRFLDAHRLRNTARRSEAESNLGHYLEWMLRETAAFIATKTRIQYAVTPDVSLGGELPRIDLLATDDGYRAVIIGESDADWRSQIRMPLIQRAVAETLKRPERLVSVGVQQLDGEGLDTMSYSKRRIDAAVGELESLVAAASRALSR
jgi:hypothetical protein